MALSLICDFSLPWYALSCSLELLWGVQLPLDHCFLVNVLTLSSLPGGQDGAEFLAFPTWEKNAPEVTRQFSRISINRSKEHSWDYQVKCQVPKTDSVRKQSQEELDVISFEALGRGIVLGHGGVADVEWVGSHSRSDNHIYPNLTKGHAPPPGLNALSC